MRPPHPLKRLTRADLAAVILHALGTMRKLLLRSALVAFAVPILVSSALGQSPSTSSEQVVLTPGDSVRIVVWRKPEMSGDFIVASKRREQVASFQGIGHRAS